MQLHLSGNVQNKFTIWRLTGPQRIGRSSKNDIQVLEDTVSKEHAEIGVRGDRLYLRDLGSRNGTRVNGVDAREPIELTAGDRVEIGHVVLAITAEEPSQPLQFSDATVVGSSLRLRADQLLSRSGKQTAMAAPALLPLLAQFGQLLVLPRPMRETCDQILELVERAMPASRHILLLRPEGGGDPVQIAGRYGRGSADRPLALSRAIVRTVFEECTAVLTADAALDPRFKDNQSIVVQAVHSAMAVPLFDNEKVLGLIYVDRQDSAGTFGEEQLEVLTLLANMAAVKITNARLLEAEEDRIRIKQELARAAGMQRDLVPTRLPEVPGYALDAHLDTCFEVGGDLYDFRRLSDGSLHFVLGDVAGKGIDAAIVMSSFLSAARVLYEATSDPGAFATRLGQTMDESTESWRYVTGIVGRLDPATGAIRYVNAGHLAACIVGPGPMRQLPSANMPFGMMPGTVYATQTAELAPGETLVMFSDGIPEAQRGEEFFEEERLHVALKELVTGAPLADIRAAILERVEAFSAGEPRTDDITLVMIRREA